MATKVTARIKGKKKKWFPIIAPKIFNKKTIGEMHLYIPEQAVGRHVSINLMNLTGDIKKQNTVAKFVINNIGEGKLYADIVGYHIMPTAVKRMVRRKVAKILMSFIVKTADSKKVRIKPLVLTRGAAKQSVLTRIRKKTEESLKTLAEKTKFENIFQEIISHKLQMGFKKQLGKIFPIRSFEIRMLNIVEEKTPKEKPKVEKKKTVPKKEPEAKEEKTEAEKPKKEKKTVPKKEPEAKEEKKE